MRKKYAELIPSDSDAITIHSADNKPYSSVIINSEKMHAVASQSSNYEAAVVGVLAHEAFHIFQRICYLAPMEDGDFIHKSSDTSGREYPSDEMAAYTIGDLTSKLLKKWWWYRRKTSEEVDLPF